MVSERTIELSVGLFLMAAIMGLVILAFKVSGLTSFFRPDGYTITAAFDDIGQLKIRAPVKMSGVVIGEVSAIHIDPATFKAIVSLFIESHIKDIPDDSSASILTSGLLGDNYISIVPMNSNEYLKQGSELVDTHSAIILEKLIGQFIYKMGNTENGAKK